MSDAPQTMNSLDCWDYTIELECLQGNQGTNRCIKVNCCGHFRIEGIYKKIKYLMAFPVCSAQK